MYTFSEEQKKEMKRILVEELNLSAIGVEFFLEDFSSVNDIFAPAIEQWLKDRTIVDLNIEGVTISEVMKKRRCNFLSAISELNVLLDETIPKDRRERYKETLKKPIRFIDTIVIDNQPPTSKRKI